MILDEASFGGKVKLEMVARWLLLGENPHSLNVDKMVAI